jgi:catechol 2,3-dioxygenase-like lactoylglutathione lyase family enzyme
MLDHVSFSVADIKRSIAFYEKALAPLGIKLLAELTPEMTDMGGHGGHEAGFGTDQRAFFWISTGKALKGRLHVAFAAKDRAAVAAFYEAAIKAGGKDNGPPGLRPHYHQDYFGAFVLDPDGHNIEAVSRNPA